MGDGNTSVQPPLETHHPGHPSIVVTSAGTQAGHSGPGLLGCRVGWIEQAGAGPVPGRMHAGLAPRPWPSPGGGIGDGGHCVAGGRQLSDQEPSQWRQGSGPLRITARGLVLASAVQLDTGRGEVPFNPVP